MYQGPVRMSPEEPAGTRHVVRHLSSSSSTAEAATLRVSTWTTAGRPDARASRNPDSSAAMSWPSRWPLVVPNPERLEEHGPARMTVAIGARDPAEAELSSLRDGRRGRAAVVVEHDHDRQTGQPMLFQGLCRPGHGRSRPSHPRDCDDPPRMPRPAWLPPAPASST